MPKKYYKIEVGEVSGKNYFGLFVSTNEEFACELDTFVRGWELDRYNQLSETEKLEFAKGLNNDVAGKNYSQAK